MRRWLLPLFIFVSLSAVGCATSHEPTPRATTLPIKFEPRYEWFQTINDDATEIMTTHLTVPGWLNDKTQEFRLARYEIIDANGHWQLVGMDGPLMENADGRNTKGGFGYNGFISVTQDEHDDNALLLNVRYSWTTPDQVKGNIDETAHVKVGVPADVKFSAGRHLRVVWTSVNRSAIISTTQMSHGGSR